MIYDCFLYYDEDMLLELRLNTLNEVIDKFVIVESTHSFTGIPKPLNFNIDKFPEFKDKIIYVVYDSLPKLKNGVEGENDAWANEAATRNATMRGLRDAKDDDIIIISDVDEIFTPEAIKQINPKKLCTTFHMNFFNYQFNLQVFNKDGSPRLCTLPRATTLRNLRDRFGGNAFDFRNVKSTKIYKDFLSRLTFKYRNKIVKNAGWHFSWVMSPERISKKMSTISHTEHDTPEFNNPEHIMKVITNAEDIWGRDRKLVKQDLKNPEFPAYLVDNKEKFKEFII